MTPVFAFELHIVTLPQCEKIFMMMYPEQTRILYTISYQRLLATFAILALVPSFLT